MKKWSFLFLYIYLFNLSSSYAQDQDDFIQNTRNDIMLVAGAGAAGAILGLSTLSFYDKPSVNVSNIWTGAAIGIALGVVYVAYNSAQKGTEELTSEYSSKNFGTKERQDWHSKITQNQAISHPQLYTSFWSMTF